MVVTKLKIKFLTFQGAPENMQQTALSRLEKLIPLENIEITETKPDVLFFLTGGSEQAAVEQVSQGHFYILIGSQHDNSYASATEVKAYLNALNIPSILLDEEDPQTSSALSDFLIIKKTLKSLKGKRIGLIGQVSPWLISSSIPPEVLKAKFGIKIIEIPWHTHAHYSEYKPSRIFLDSFSHEKHLDLTNTAKVSELLSGTIKKYELDAITVECFPMVQKDGVTACLPLAYFNNSGIPAGCEGDITSIVGMVLCKELTGIIPWMANINKAAFENCMFSHCTIDPDLVSDFVVKTHFETGKGTAIEGNFKGNLVTIFRLDNKLRKAFIASAQITSRPKSITACRTQIMVKLSDNEVKLLREQPLGNHHLILPGDFKNLFFMLCKILNIDVLK